MIIELDILFILTLVSPIELIWLEISADVTMNRQNQIYHEIHVTSSFNIIGLMKSHTL